MLLDSGASTNLISKKVLDSCGLQLSPTTSTLVLADGNSSPILGTARVRLQLGGFHSQFSCFVTDLATDFDLIFGNTFLTEFKAILNYYTSNCTLVRDGKTYTLRPLSYNGANFDTPCSAHTVKVPVAPVAASARVPVENLLLNAAQCKRAIRKGCQSFLVMVNSAVDTFGATGSASGTANVKPDPSTSSISSLPSQQPAAEGVAYTLSQQLDSVETDFADVFAEPSGLPPDRGIEHVIALEPDAQPPFKRMYRLSPSELVGVKRQATELLQKQLIEPSVSPCGAPLLFVLKKGGELCMVIDYRALNKLTVKIDILYLALTICLISCRDRNISQV